MAFSRRTDPRSSTSLTEIPPHFFKVILPATIEEKKMRIPERFVRRFGDELSDVASLRDPNGQVWHVKLVKDGKEIWFHDGLHDFVEYHSICAGHFLVFKYAKNSNFHVLVFDKTACEVQYPEYCEELNDEKNSAQRDEMKIDNSVEVMGCRTPNPSSSSLRSKGTYRCVECGASVESKTTKHLNDPDSSTQDEHEEEVRRFSGSSSATKRTATTEERERAIEAAKAFETANPFCSVVMRSTYVQKRCLMFLPACFYAKHLQGVSGFIKLQLSDGKQWPVHCQYSGGRAKLGKGWYEFTLENNLWEGDVCVFEVLRSRNIVLKVTVFRVLETEESVNRVCFVSSLGKNRCRKCVAYLETTPKHVHDSRSSKRCKMEEVERVENSDVVGDLSELRRTANKVAARSSDGKNKSEYDDDELLALLKDKGIFVKQNFRKIAAEAKERVINIVRFLKPKNPSFMVIFQARSFDRYSLYVPAEFASKYFSRDVKIIKLQVADGREWPVQLFWRHNESVDIITGWSAFSKENNLKEGDVCLFELIRKKDFLLKVSVFQYSCD